MIAGGLSVKTAARSVGTVAHEETVADVAGAPTIGDNCSDSIFAAGKQTGDIIGMIVNSLAVIAPARCEISIAYPLQLH
jgi:hypothetical protein